MAVLLRIRRKCHFQELYTGFSVAVVGKEQHLGDEEEEEQEGFGGPERKYQSSICFLGSIHTLGALVLPLCCEQSRESASEAARSGEQSKGHLGGKHPSSAPTSEQRKYSPGEN